MANNNAIEVYGMVTEALGGDRYRVGLDNGGVVTAYPCGRMRVRHIRVLPGDKVCVGLSPYDVTNGRIIRRL